MNLDAEGASGGDDGEVGGDDGGDAGLACGLEEGAHLGKLVVVDDGVEGEVGAHAGGVGDAAYLAEVVDGEVGGGAGAHVEVAHAEVDGVGTALDGGVQAGVGAHRAHYLHFFHVAFNVPHPTNIVLHKKYSAHQPPNPGWFSKRHWFCSFSP